jgi:beta-phosphoglucomutase
MNYHRFQACIFDFDGVLVDSEPLHAKAKQATLDHFHIQYPGQIFADYKGRPDTAFFGFVATELAHGSVCADDLAVYKHELYLHLFENVPLVYGAQDFLRAARASFKKLGLATSATRRDLSLAANKYNLSSWFDAIVTGEDTIQHKPHPEPFLRALTALDVSGPQALVIEDSPNGILAAKSAECKAAALTTAFDALVLRAAGADLVVASFSELERELGMARVEPG